MYYRNANCAVVVYDITQPVLLPSLVLFAILADIVLQSSLDKAKAWVKELQRQAPEAIIIALAGNKLDLSSQRAIDTAEAEAYAKEAGLLFFETSAKSGDNVKELFSAIAKKLPLEKGNARGAGRIGAGTGGVDLRGNQKTNAQGCAC